MIRHIIDGYGFEVVRDGALIIEDEQGVIFTFTPDMLSALLLYFRASGVMGIIRTAERGRERVNEVEE